MCHFGSNISLIYNRTMWMWLYQCETLSRSIQTRGSPFQVLED